MKFNQLHLSDATLQTLDSLGFHTATPIQELALPILLEAENDFIGLAQTGTGKTLTFGLPIVERVDEQYPHTQALIIAPTRELGLQIADQIQLFTRYNRLNVLTVYGGANINTQLKALKKPQHILIATPGRLIDLLKRKAIDLSHLEFLVLDEADEMLNMGFKDDIDTILKYSSEEALTWLFSATMSKEIRKIVQQYMYAPMEIQLNPTNETNKNIIHKVASLSPRNKVEAISRIIDTEGEMRAVVFCRTKRETQEVADSLQDQGYQSGALHGDMSQAQRESVMKAFKNHRIQVLIATDIAARGIDVQDITHVIHHNLPDEVESYTHRSGRTARAGKEGMSIALVSNRDYDRYQAIQKKLKIDFDSYQIPNAKDMVQSRLERWTQTILESDARYNKEVDALYNSIKKEFKHLTKDDILKNLLQIELQNQVGSAKDLNEKLEKPKGGRNGNSGGKRRKGVKSFRGRKKFSPQSKNKSKYNSRGGKRGK